MGWRGDRGGQMSVEAAALLPVALTLLALLAQPACVLYTRSVMAATAGELARLATTSDGSEDELRAFALRRLAAVPNLEIFHAGGPEAWEVEVEGPGSGGRVTVRLVGRVRPLPLIGVAAAALGEPDGDEVVLRAEVVADMRSGWIGGDYESWVEMWG